MSKLATKRILIVAPSWVGDMVMAHSLFQMLKQREPDAELHVLAPAWSRPLLARMPEVSATIDSPFAHGDLKLWLRYQLGVALRERYEQVILLPNSLKSALAPFFARIPLRTGWRGEMRYWLLNDIRMLNEAQYPLMVQRFVALGLAPGEPLPNPLPRPRLQADEERLPELLTRFGLNRQQPVLALCPGAEFGPSKRWPESHYAEVARDRIAAGWQVWLMGSDNDAAVGRAIQSELPESMRPNCRNLAGQTELADAIDLLSVADAVVSNDSGLMHVAAALSRPLVAVYGSTSPAFTPPLSDEVAIESIPVDCGPCFKRECPLGHMKCLNDLSPKRVLKALDELVKNQKLIASTDTSESSAE